MHSGSFISVEVLRSGPKSWVPCGVVFGFWTAQAGRFSLSNTSRPFGRATSISRVLAVAAAATALTAGAISGAAGSSTAPTVRAASATKGLYGAQDPTFNGVFRQGLALMALSATKSVQQEGVSWLIRQQCADGGFEAYRSDLSKKCTKTNPATFSGPDSNSTALAAAGLAAVGKKNQMNKAIKWLLKRQNNDGGWTYYDSANPKEQSDANSTAVVTMALFAAGKQPTKIKQKGKSPLNYLSSVQLKCSAPSKKRGAVDFQKTSPLTANNLASAQAGMSLAPIINNGKVLGKAKKSRKGWKNFSCTKSLRGDVSYLSEYQKNNTTRGTLIGYLARTLNNNKGAIPAAFGPGADVGSTANAVMALGVSGDGSGAMKKGLKVLKANAGTYLRSPSESGPIADNAASLSAYILAVHASGGNPKKWNGTNLVARLQKTLRK